MKYDNLESGRKFAKGKLVLAIAAAVLALQATGVDAQVITLAHNNSIAFIDTGSQAGMFNWQVEGQNQLAQQWFWYRVGNLGPEAAINTISGPIITQPNARQVTVLYGNFNPVFSLQVDYLMTGGVPGSGQSDIGESILIQNKTAAPLDFHFFQYSDFDLGGIAGGDTVQLGKNLSGTRFNEAIQSKGGVAFTETVTVPGANHGETAFFNATLLKLNDGVADILSDQLFPGPLGPGDVTWAFQWDLLIPANGSALISKDKYLEINVVPEPSTVLLTVLGFGLVLATQAYRRRNRE
jgi:hypothetical protein